MAPHRDLSPATPALGAVVASQHDDVWARLPYLVPMTSKVARQCRNGGDGCAALASLVAELRSVLLDHLEREEVIELLERIRRVGLVDAHARDGACAAERALHRELALLDDHVRWQIVLEERLLAARLD